MVRRAAPSCTTHHKTERGYRPGMNVLIATDGSDPAIDAARSALPLFAADAKVTLVTVVPPAIGPEVGARLVAVGTATKV